VSDHGFKLVNGNRERRVLKAGLLKAEQEGVGRRRGRCGGGSAIVYVTVRSSGQSSKARQALEGIDGIDQVIEPKDYPQYGLPLPSANEQMGALFLTAKDGYAFTAAIGDDAVIDAPAGSLGAHGYVGSDPEMLSLFIASGRGVKPGTRLDVIDNIHRRPLPFSGSSSQRRTAGACGNPRGRTVRHREQALVAAAAII
jgi:hypothetical protein